MSSGPVSVLLLRELHGSKRSGQNGPPLFPFHPFDAHTIVYNSKCRHTSQCTMCIKFYSSTCSPLSEVCTCSTLLFLFVLLRFSVQCSNFYLSVHETLSFGYSKKVVSTAIGQHSHRCAVSGCIFSFARNTLVHVLAFIVVSS